VIVCFVAAACLHAPASAGAWAGSGHPFARPPISLVASPAYVSLTGAGREEVTVTSSGRQPVVVEVARAGYALDLRGRPRVGRLRASWLGVRPRRARIAPGESTTFVVASSPPRRAEPGDHSELVLLVTRPLRTAALAVRMRLGVIVVVRVRGRIVRRLTPVGLRARRRGRARQLELLLRNAGNVTEALDTGCLTLGLRRRGRLVHLRPVARTLLPHTRGLAEFRYPKRWRGRAVVRIERRRRCPGLALRRFVLRL
jgi:hypothetical protein